MTPTGTANLFDFAKGFVGQRPVYYGNTKIGYWQDSASHLCNGSVVLEVPVSQAGDPTRWETRDDFWRRVPVTQFCVASGYNPAWASKEDIEKAKIAAPPGTAILTLPEKIVGDVLKFPKQMGSAGKWVFVGAAGIALILFLRGRR